MKISTGILTLVLAFLVGGLFATNMILKKQYDAIDKRDIYWTYDKILEKPFKHLHITGGNKTHIYYEPGPSPSVRLLSEWVRYHEGHVKTNISNDTLYLDFDYKPANLFEKVWLENAAPVRIFSPELYSISGTNTNFEIQRFRQKSLDIKLNGKSDFELETMEPEMDSLSVTMNDSSAAVIELSPDYSTELSSQNENESKGTKIKITLGNQADQIVNTTTLKEDMFIRSLYARVMDHSILHAGHAQVNRLDVRVSDSSAIVLSGDALHKLTRFPGEILGNK